MEHAVLMCLKIASKLCFFFANNFPKMALNSFSLSLSLLYISELLSSFCVFIHTSSVALVIAMSACRSVHFGPSISTTIGRTAMKLCRDVHAPLRMNFNNLVIQRLFLKMSKYMQN